MTHPKVLTFEEWKKLHPTAEDELEICDECNGRGEHECDCGDCHTCRNCGGTGFYDPARDEYKAILAEQEKRWREYEKATQRREAI